jgi:hypothetical protein
MKMNNISIIKSIVMINVLFFVTVMCSANENKFRSAGLNKNESKSCIDQQSTFSSLHAKSDPKMLEIRDTIPSIQISGSTYLCTENAWQSKQHSTFMMDKRDLDKWNIKVFPNPAHGIVHISPGDIPMLIVEVRKSTGNLVYSNTIDHQVSIPIHTLEPGIYFARFYNVQGGLIHMEKLLVQ